MKKEGRLSKFRQSVFFYLVWCASKAEPHYLGDVHSYFASGNVKINSVPTPSVLMTLIFSS